MPRGVPTGKKCGARKTKGGVCSRPAGWGTDHTGFGRCKNHTGSTPSGKRHAAREAMLDLHAKTINYGGALEITPEAALLQEVHRTAGHVSWLGLEVEQIEKANLVGPVGSEGTNDSGVTFHPGYKPSVWIELYQSERAHLARVCKMAIDAGIAERQVRIAEQQGEMLAGAIRAILEDLGVAGHPKAPEVVRRHLMALPGAEESA